MLTRARGSSRWSESDLRTPRKKKTSSHMNIEQFRELSPKKNESKIQIDLFGTLSLIPYRGVKLVDFIYAIPNGGYRPKKTGGIQKAEGLKRGVPDIHCFIAIAPYHSLYIEMKTEKGELSQYQEAVIKLLRQEGHKVVVCRSEQSALREIFKYLGIKQ